MSAIVMGPDGEDKPVDLEKIQVSNPEVSMDITDHYELVEDARLFETLKEAD